MRKNITFFFALFLLFVSLAYGKHTNDINNYRVKGIYLSLENFKNNIFNCSQEKQEKNIKIKLKQFFSSPEISCVKLDNKTEYNKDIFFAVHLSNGENYRFLNRIPYLIADTSFLYIYTYKTIKIEHKEYSSTGRAIEIPVTHYYFSTRKNISAHQLTLARSLLMMKYFISLLSH